MGDIEKNLSDENITKDFKPPSVLRNYRIQTFFIDLRRTFEK